MAALDSVIPFPYQKGTLVIKDGTNPTANQITVTYEQGTFSFSAPGRSYSEAMGRGRRSTSAAPVLMDGDDGVVTGQFSFLITSFLGDSNVHPYEAVTFSGNASSWVTTSRGTRKSLELVFTADSSEATGGGTQTLTFKYCVITNPECDMNAVEGKAQLTVSFTDHENLPTAA